MASNLQSTIHGLANGFANRLLEAIREASLDEILGIGAAGSGVAPVKRGPGRPPGSGAKRGPGRPPRAAAPASTGGGKKALGRRSSGDIETTIARIQAALKKAKAGLRSEQLQKELGLAKNEIVRPLQKALEEKTISKKGEKRATTYFAR